MNKIGTYGRGGKGAKGNDIMIEQESLDVSASNEVYQIFASLRPCVNCLFAME